MPRSRTKQTKIWKETKAMAERVESGRVRHGEVLGNWASVGKEEYHDKVYSSRHRNIDRNLVNYAGKNFMTLNK